MGQKEILRTQPTRVRRGWSAREVYKLKEEHEEGDRTEKERERTDINEREESKRRERELY